MTDEELNAIEILTKKASPGPWCCTFDQGSDFTVIAGCGEIPDENRICENEVLGTSEWIRVKASDLELMASARTTIPALIAEIRRLKEVIKDHQSGLAS